MTYDPDVEIRAIAERLPAHDRDQFLSAINHIRKNSNRGRVRLRKVKPPDARQQMILDTFAECGNDLRATEAKLADQGVTYNQVAYVTRRFGVRDIKYHKWLAKPDDVVLTYLRDARRDDYTATTVKKELAAHYGHDITESSFRVLCEAAGVTFERVEFDVDRIEELVEDLRVLERKYGISVETMKTYFYRAMRAGNVSRERR